jgi:formylglycine-generating enzyme required for sulfatase activity
MSSQSPVGCARCGRLLDARFRFCPECGLPVSGDGVLSTEIAEVRRRAEARPGRESAWRRWLLPTATTGMLAFVALLGVVLFDERLIQRLLPPTPHVQTIDLPRWEPAWRQVAPGTFPYGDPSEGRRGEVPYSYLVSKHEVTNALWHEFLASERRRLDEMGLWQEAFPKDVEGWSFDRARGELRLDENRRTYPVTDVSPVAIVEFCAWLTRRLDRTGWEIRIPTQLEWEYAARGTKGQTYPWGEDDVKLRQRFTGPDNTRLRTGLTGAAIPVGDAQLAQDDTSPFGVVAMGTNVSEWTLMVDFAERAFDAPNDAPEREMLSLLPPVAAAPPVKGLRQVIEEKDFLVAWRGASFSCDEWKARSLARAWRSVPDEPRNAKYDVGIRLVKVAVAK